MNFFKPILFLFVGMFLVNICVGQTKIMSFNIRYDNPNDGSNRWELRKSEVVALLNYYKPDFFGLQEALPNQIDYIAANLEAYNSIGHGRDGLDTNSEGTPIFYDRENFDLLNSDVFWLSETPEKPSKGWDASLNRIAVYGVFKSKDSGDIIHIFNVHFDHLGRIAREKSAEQLIKYIKTNNLLNERIVLMGDLNCLPTESPVKILNQYLEDSFKANELGTYGPFGTFNGFDTEKILTQRIDYIFVRNLDVYSYRAIDDKRKNNLYPSDHLPILIKL